SCFGSIRQGRSWYTMAFFFQAEDGIRDKLVTGVQTCALPISHPALQRHAHRMRRTPHARASGCLAGGAGGFSAGAVAVGQRGSEIGRASCRERVAAAGGGGEPDTTSSACTIWRASRP